MKEIVQKEVPVVLNRHISDFEKVNKIREWVNEQTIWGTLPDNEINTMINKKTSLEMYKYYLSHTEKAYDCGSYSVFLHKIYQLFGYESYIYDMGKDNQFRHTVVLVWIKDEGKKKLIIEDPSYNITYIDIKTNPLDYFQFIEYLKNDKKRVFLKKSIGKGQKMICKLNNTCNPPSSKILKTHPNGFILFRNQFDTQIIEDNLASFLYIRDIRYFEKVKDIFPVLSEIKIAIFKTKTCSIVSCALKCRNIPTYLLLGEYSAIMQAIPLCIKN
jgi:hypothetical protein